MPEVYANGCSTTVTGGYTPGSGVLNVASTASPWPSTGNYRLVILDATFTTVKVILKVTGVNSGTQFAVTAEGVDASALDGDPVRGTEITAAMLDSMRGDMSAQGADASLPATTNHKAGDVYQSNDLPYLYVFDGASWVKYSVGAKVLLKSVSANNTSVNLDATGWYNAAFDEYEIHLVDIIPITSAITLGMRVSNGGVFDTGANYNSNDFEWLNGATGTGGGGAGQTSFSLARSVSIATSVPGLSGRFILSNPGSAKFKSIYGEAQAADTSGGTRVLGWVYGFMYTSTSAIDGIRILSSSGNINSGTMRIYGIAKGITI
jgi:hypothetical protein